MKNPKHQVIFKFSALLLILVGYFAYLTYQYDFLTGGIAALITWSFFRLSAIGTFLSIRFGDELMDVLHHKDREFFYSNHFKHEIVLFVFFLFVLLSYYELIATLGISVENA